jgi:3D-(3,5/4)-trihydroxycyclohexane-1,2-dione acylhydrolase (decyclizing)
MTETIAGKGAVVHDHPAYTGAMGIEGTDASKELAETADVVIAVGTRLQDFTTGSWTTFAPEAKFININAARYDASKHFAQPVVGDALECLARSMPRWATGHASQLQMARAQALYSDWNKALDEGQKATNARVPSYAQVIARREQSGATEDDTMVTLPAGCRGRRPRTGASRHPTPTTSSSAFPAWGTRLPAAGATPWPKPVPTAGRWACPSSWWATGRT